MLEYVSGLMLKLNVRLLNRFGSFPKLKEPQCRP